MLVRILIIVTALLWAPKVSAQETQQSGEPEESQTEESRVPPAARAGRDPLGPILMISAGLVVVGSGLTLFLVGASDRRAVENAEVGSSWDDFASRAERGPVFLGIGQIIMAAGIIVVAAGISWFALNLTDVGPGDLGRADALELKLDIVPGGMLLRGRF